MDEIKRRRDVERVAEAIEKCVTRFFGDALIGEPGIRLIAEPEGRSTYQDGRGVACVIHFRMPGNGDPIDLHMNVDNSYAGNVFHADVAVEGGEVQRCPVNVPDPFLNEEAISPDDFQMYVDDLCNHILTELKLAVGERELRKTAGAT